MAGVEDAVGRATDALAGSNKGIVDEMIYLELTRPGCPDLTMIDLPGITRVPIGDQPPDIGQQIHSLIRKHIAGKSKVLLCMVCSDQDTTTAEAFTLAQEADPEGRRTLGVFTKIDKAEPGIRAKLEGTGKGDVHLGLGFVGVRCRKPEELELGLSEADVRQLEQEFIQGHPELSQVDPSCLGMPALVSKLCSLQLRVIHTTLPTMKTQVQEKLRGIEKQLAALPALVTSEYEALLTCQLLLHKVGQQFAALADGNLTALDRSSVSDVDSLVVSARVLEKCESYYVQVQQDVNVQSFLGDSFRQELRSMIRNARGISLSNFLSHPVFELAYTDNVHSKRQNHLWGLLLS